MFGECKENETMCRCDNAGSTYSRDINTGWSLKQAIQERIKYEKEN